MRKVKKSLALIIGFMLAMLQVVMVSANPVSENIISKEIVELENGDSLEIVISEPAISLFAGSTRKGAKTVTYKANGVAMWYVKVNGVYSYTGSSSTCTSASVEADTYSSSWKVSNKSSSKSGNTATAKATGKLYYGITVVDTITETVNLSCSSNGTLY